MIGDFSFDTCGHLNKYKFSNFKIQSKSNLKSLNYLLISFNQSTGELLNHFTDELLNQLTHELFNHFTAYQWDHDDLKNCPFKIDFWILKKFSKKLISQN